jgi:hypothetical protein
MAFKLSSALGGLEEQGGGRMGRLRLGREGDLVAELLERTHTAADRALAVATVVVISAEFLVSGRAVGGS